ncbi:MAG: hypothetical protein PHT71_05920 [Victivallaceae bacterium]|jgi:hypothetical protein|nr:hypothetical protein [Victivallaceae bacterium]
MIGLDFYWAFILYLEIWLATILVLWIRELRRLRQYDAKVGKSELCRCEKCNYNFLIDNNNNIARCPRCNEMCILRKRRKWHY